MWLIGIGVAHAGFAVGGVVGAEIPTSKPSLNISLDPGPVGGVLVGYRADLAVLHLQPEAQILYSTVRRNVELNVGAAITVLSPLAFGVAGHVGTAPGKGSTWDGLGVIEITMIPKVKPGVRAGVGKLAGYGPLYGIVEGVVVIAF